MSENHADPGLDEIRERSEQLDRQLEPPNDRLVRVSDNLLQRLRWQQEDGAETVPTYLESWNRACRDEGGGQGLALGWYVVVAGLTGAGKTLVGLNLAAEALRTGENVLYFSLEMSWQQLCSRLRAITAGTDITEVEWGPHRSEEAAREADRELLNLPGDLYLNIEPIWKLNDVLEVLEVHRNQCDVTLAVVDYAQLVSPAGADRKLFEKMSHISSQLRYAAQKFDVVTVALSQLNRSSTADRGRKPTVDGLFGSSRFGFDADQVAVLDYSRREKDEVHRIERTWINLVKNRHGPAVEIPVALEKKNLRIREAKPHEESEWPGMGGLR